MKYKKQVNAYKNSTGSCLFDVTTCTAVSYGWWQFVKRIGDHIVFNNYYYSISTRKHQNAIKDLLKTLKIDINFYVEAPEGLQNIDSAFAKIDNDIEELTCQMNKKGSKKAQNAIRLKSIASLQIKRLEVQKIKDLQEMDDFNQSFDRNVKEVLSGAFKQDKCSR